MDDRGVVEGQITLLEGETVDYCCDDYDETIEQFICRTVPEGASSICYDYCVHYGLCTYWGWTVTSAVSILEKDFCCVGTQDAGTGPQAVYPCSPVADNSTCNQPC